MAGAGTKMGTSQTGVRKVGRKRQPQSKDIARTYKGRFGQRLAALAETANLDADKLGGKIGKSGDTVRLYFAGRVAPPLDDFPAIAKALGVTVAKMMPE